MKAIINNFRGCIAAAFDIDSKPTFIFGNNGDGKTSICHALIALLTGNTVPIELNKSQCEKIITDGKKNSRIRLEDENFTAEINYPEAKLITTGSPPFATPIACGTDSLLFMDQKTRGKIISNYLKAEPTENDFKQALETAGIQFIQKLWDNIKVIGFDGAFSNAKEKGSKLKGQWEYITGEKFGTAKIKHWLPKDWDYTLEKKTEAELKKDVEDKKAWLESAIKAEAVSESKIQDLEKEISENEKYINEFDIKNIETLISNFEQNKKDLEQKLIEHPPYDNTTVYKCPKCNSKLVLQNKQLVKIGDKLNDDAVKNRNENVLKWKKGIADADRAIQEHKQNLGMLNNKIEETTISKNKLNELKSQKNIKSAKSVEDCKNDLGNAEKLLLLFKAKEQADNISKKIELNQAIVKILSPKGLRKDIINKCLKDFNESLLSLTKIANWAKVEIDGEYNITYNGRICGFNPDKSLCSESEWFKTKIILQVAFADIDKSNIILIDGTEKLMNEGRKGLLKISTVNTIIFMAINNKSEIKDKLKEIVNCNWIENGELINL